MFFFFFFNDTATTEIYTLSLHDALPISAARRLPASPAEPRYRSSRQRTDRLQALACSRSVRCRLDRYRSEEHTSELQSRRHLVCRLLLEKKKIHPPKPVEPQATAQSRPG